MEGGVVAHLQFGADDGRVDEIGVGEQTSKVPRELVVPLLHLVGINEVFGARLGREVGQRDGVAGQFLQRLCDLGVDGSQSTVSVGDLVLDPLVLLSVVELERDDVQDERLAERVLFVLVPAPDPQLDGPRRHSFRRRRDAQR